MALEQKLSLKMSQKLVMTPSLQQAIKLLQMTRLELETTLTQEMVENPVLEETENLSDDEAPAEAETEDRDSLDEIDFEAFFSDADSWESSGKSSLFEVREAAPLENTLTREEDLYDHLLWQLRMMDIDPLLKEIAELIIGNLSPEGFFMATIEEIQTMGLGDDLHDEDEIPPEVIADMIAVGEEPLADVPRRLIAEMAEIEAALGQLPLAPTETGPTETSPTENSPTEAGSAEAVSGDGDDALIDDELIDEVGGYPRATVEEALALVQNLDPPGVACRDLRESLMRQLEARGADEDDMAYRVIAESWDLFMHRKFEAIAKKLEIPLAELEPVVEEIKSLDTRPGRQYAANDTRYVEPDVQVIKVGDKYVIQLNDDGLPKLRVSRAYRKILQALRQKGQQGEAQQFIKDKMRSAIWLIKSLDQRQRTIYKVASSIVRQQRAFLDYGIDHLRPMVLRDVAEDIEMHESTVSRVVSNKYIHTPRGLLPLKFFFHSGIDREYGGDISSLTVKRKIQHLVQGEDAHKPLSDSELMRTLNREGVKIARRTVAKYRDELGIPSSTERKQIF